MVTVLNLSTGEEQIFSCDPQTAVQSAYAKEHNKMSYFIQNNWTLPDTKVMQTELTVSCGDWCAFKNR